MRGEVRRDLVVEGGRADRSEPQRVRRQLQLRAEERRLQLGQPVATVAEVLQHRLQVGQRVGVDVRVGGIVLIAGQAAGGVAHLAGSEQLERLLLGVHGV